ncbi:MAG: DUF3093 domain-containing protein [Micropruina sp.]|uniref:DUF3093 domain-containing protein n=1 Tax=Micropruina sp. TaxID=2737536 RepID=UPI0039E42AA1
MSRSRPTPNYSERLSVPAAYWVIALFFGLSFVTAVTFMLGELILLVSTIGTIAVIAWTLLAWGSLRIEVDADGVRVGRSLLEWPYIGTVTVADRAMRARVLAREDAFLALRPYVTGLVLVGVADDADPHLCWLVSTRDSESLVRAIEDNRPSGVAETTERSRLDSGG